MLPRWDTVSQKCSVCPDEIWKWQSLLNVQLFNGNWALFSKFQFCCYNATTVTNPRCPLRVFLSMCVFLSGSRTIIGKRAGFLATPLCPSIHTTYRDLIILSCPFYSIVSKYCTYWWVLKSDLIIYYQQHYLGYPWWAFVHMFVGFIYANFLIWRYCQ